jgi:hypothetical protein
MVEATTKVTTMMCRHLGMDDEIHDWDSLVFAALNDESLRFR